jgi:hypothetical protein
MPRCPRCLSPEVRWERGALECRCGVVVRPYRGELATHATGICHPTWEDDHRLSGEWDRYSRRRRQDAGGKLVRHGLDVTLEQLDQRADGEARENVDRIQELAAAVGAIREDLVRAGVVAGDLARGRKRPRRAQRVWPPAVKAMLETWVALRCFFAVELENARLRRGGYADLVARSRPARAEPYAGYRHAIAAAHGVDEGSARACSIRGGAAAKHSLPRGVQFGRIACHPTKAAWTTRELGTDAGDIWDAIRDARIGRRTRWEDGQVVVEPGRQLTEAELELLRLVDAGEWFPAAKSTVKGNLQLIERDAVEYLHPRDALARLRGRAGAPQTEHQARLLLKEARRAIAVVLEERGLIPVHVRRAQARAPKVDPFAGAGATP